MSKVRLTKFTQVDANNKDLTLGNVYTVLGDTEITAGEPVFITDDVGEPNWLAGDEWEIADAA